MSSSENTNSGGFRYQWMTFGDLNGFFGVMFDNVTVLAFLAFILTGIFEMPGDIVYGKIFPGTAFGVLVGDIIYTWLAFVQARRQKKNVTAMPLGLDTPSTIGIAFTVLGPAFIGYKNAGMTPDTAALHTWYVGMACMIYCGLFKVVGAFIGGWLSKIVPQAGLMGSLAGVGIALLCVVPMVEIMDNPLVGFVALGLIFYNMVARIKLPGNLPSVLMAVVIGTVLYYVFGVVGNTLGVSLVGLKFATPEMDLHLGLPIPTLGFIHGLRDGLQYLPVIIPFSILTIIGGVNVTESARLAGDNYDTKEILWVEAASTLVAGICGGVAQTTPYIGQPAFKKMDCRAGYTLLTGLFVGFCGIIGIIKFIVDAVPTAALAPILCFVGIDIVVQAFACCKKAHFPAVALAFVPNICRILAIKFDYSSGFAALLEKLAHEPGRYLDENLVIPAMANGFILTAMMWGAFLALMIDRRLKESSVYLFILGILSFFGIIHSVSPSGTMYLPWNLSPVEQAVPYQFASGYVLLAIMIFALSFTKEAQEPPEDEEADGSDVKAEAAAEPVKEDPAVKIEKAETEPAGV